jgi:hypothetical protein
VARVPGVASNRRRIEDLRTSLYPSASVVGSANPPADGNKLLRWLAPRGAGFPWHTCWLGGIPCLFTLLSGLSR